MTHVCQRWRDVASNHQILWTDIIVEVGRHTLLWPVQQSLARSGTMPIDIHIASTVDTRAAVMGHTMKTVLEIIAANAYRWRSFRTERNADATLFYIICILKPTQTSIMADPQLIEHNNGIEKVGVSSVPCINTWEVGFINFGAVYDIPIGSAPLLRSVTLRNLLWVPPMQAVRRLHLDSINTFDSSPHDSFGAIFNNLPMLEDLTIRASIVYRSHLLSFIPCKIKLPSLTTLQLLASESQTDPAPQASFLRAISAPQLQCLVLENSALQDIQTLEDVKLPLLRSIAIAPGRDSRQGILLLSSIFPTITRLNITSPLDLAHSLVHTNPAVQAWLHLETLTLHELASSQIVPLCDSLLVRSLTCQLPRRIVLRNCDDIAVNALLTSLHDRELDIEVYTSAEADAPWYEDVEAHQINDEFRGCLTSIIFTEAITPLQMFGLCKNDGRICSARIYGENKMLECCFARRTRGIREAQKASWRFENLT
ncbi:hypothetical protein HWV62_5231 [Athelia sp. TMB]|nr:hypothetical protein HWV62_5231 [Athelia sp. TMB]